MTITQLLDRLDAYCRTLLNVPRHEDRKSGELTIERRKPEEYGDAVGVDSGSPWYPWDVTP